MTTAVLIHGFSGSPESWRRIKPLLQVPTHTPAVCGRAGSEDGSPGEDRSAGHTFEAEVSRLALEIEARASPPRLVAGYSLGGRLALGLLVHRPNLFAGAALIGANPGIDAEDEREARRASDEKWARCIEQQGLDAFDSKWSDLPLFRSQKRLGAEVLGSSQLLRRIEESQ